MERASGDTGWPMLKETVTTVATQEHFGLQNASLVVVNPLRDGNFGAKISLVA